jgi:hypothetical protein
LEERSSLRLRNDDDECSSSMMNNRLDEYSRGHDSADTKCTSA